MLSWDINCDSCKNAAWREILHRYETLERYLPSWVIDTARFRKSHVSLSSIDNLRTSAKVIGTECASFRCLNVTQVYRDLELN